MAIRSALLKHLRIDAAAVASSRGRLLPLSVNALARWLFSDEVKGSFLDKSEVADRVVSVVKNFQRVDPSKLGYGGSCDGAGGEFGFEIPDNEADKINSIYRAVDFIASGEMKSSSEGNSAQKHVF